MVLKNSPHGKVLVLVVDEQPLFESNTISEFLDEDFASTLHPKDSLKRARNRSWNEYVGKIGGVLRELFYAKSKEKLASAKERPALRFEKLEAALNEERGNDGPYFNGADFSMVDASYAPILQRFRFIDLATGSGVMEVFPLLSSWTDALMANELVSNSLPLNFEEKVLMKQKRNGCYLGTIWKRGVV